MVSAMNSCFPSCRYCKQITIRGFCVYLRSSRLWKPWDRRNIHASSLNCMYRQDSTRLGTRDFRGIVSINRNLTSLKDYLVILQKNFWQKLPHCGMNLTFCIGCPPWQQRNGGSHQITKQKNGKMKKIASVMLIILLLVAWIIMRRKPSLGNDRLICLSVSRNAKYDIP